jgi:hypothetical protein
MKNWNGTIRVSGIIADVNVVIQSKTRWRGSGTIVLDARDEVMCLYYTGRLEKTEIGSIAIDGCKKENGLCMFTFAGAGAILI